MTIRIHLFGAALLAGAATFAAMPAQALTAQECSAKYQAAKSAGTLGGQKWNDFRKAQCGADATPAAAATEAPKAAEPEAAAPKEEAAKSATAPAAAAPAAAELPFIRPPFHRSIRLRPRARRACIPVSISTTPTRRRMPMAA